MQRFMPHVIIFLGLLFWQQSSLGQEKTETKSNKQNAASKKSDLVEKSDGKDRTSGQQSSESQTAKNAKQTGRTQNNRSQNSKSQAANKSGSGKSDRANAQSNRAKPVEQQAKRIESLMAFIDQHHPDLRRLLGVLEKKKPSQHRQAMKTLFRQFDRLSALEDKDPKKYDVSLRLWKVESRIQYVSAQMALNGVDEFQERLKTLLKQQSTLKVELQQLEISRTQSRLKKLREELAKHKENNESNLEKSFDQIVNTAKRRHSELVKNNRKNDSAKKPVQSNADPVKKD